MSARDNWIAAGHTDPIIFMPMTTGATAGINEGTGGDFMQQGLIETADRGANQPNGAMCTIDGSNYLTHTTETGATLSYWSVNSGIMTHNYSTGIADSQSIGNITSALGDAVGEVYLTTATIAESEFITDDGRAIPVRDVIANTGDNPKIALSCSADNPTKNLGSSGDYTEIGSVSGARGASEYIARSAKSDGSTGYLDGVSVSDSKILTFVCAFYADGTTSDNYIISSENDSSSIKFFIEAKSDDIKIVAYYQENNNEVLEAILTNVLTIDTWNTVMVSLDLTDTNKRHIYVNGSSINITWSKYFNDVITYTNMFCLGNPNYSYYTQFPISTMYFTTDYIDFSLESNRNLFVNQLGYPRDLTPEIEAGNIPTPLIYLPFDDTSNLGKNLGTGGDMTVVGGVTSGSDFAI
jgi:hypothetical protein